MTLIVEMVPMRQFKYPEISFRYETIGSTCKEDSGNQSEFPSGRNEKIWLKTSNSQKYPPGSQH